MLLYTDYPLQESEYGKIAPIRKVKVLKYDGDKYVMTLHSEFGENEIKRGYLYPGKGRCGEVECVAHQELMERVPSYYD